MAYAQVTMTKGIYNLFYISCHCKLSLYPLIEDFPLKLEKIEKESKKLPAKQEIHNTKNENLLKDISLVFLENKNSCVF